MSDSESEHEVCGGIFACDNCCGLYADDLEGCCEGCTETVLPCWVEDVDDPCACDCCGMEFRFVTDCDIFCCNICTHCMNFFAAFGTCFGHCMDFFGAVWTFIKWIFNFEIKRKALYGADVNPNADGRNPCLSGCVSAQNEHYIMVILAMLLSAADTGTDCYVLYKWLTFEPNEWEAVVLIGVMVTSWAASSWLRIKWKPEDDVDEEESCCYKWICSSLPFHFVGLGVFAEGAKSLGDWDLDDNYKNVAPFKWVEMLFESAPSALLTIYVISKDSINANDQETKEVLAEWISIIISLGSIAFGMATTVTQEIPKARGINDVGESGPIRLFVASLLVLSDLIFRMFLLTMWVNYGNVLGIEQTWLKFIMGMGAVWVFEMIIVSMNGMIFAWWQVPIQAWISIFQGGVSFFSRSWPSEDKANRGHKRNIMTFFIRYLANWGVFLWIYFDLSQQEGTYINKDWTDILIIAAAIEPLLFMLKPPSVTAREAFPFIQIVTELGWGRGQTTFFERRSTKNASIQMTNNPAGGRVAFGNQSSQVMDLSEPDSDFV